MKNYAKWWVILALTLSSYAENSVYYFLIFDASKEQSPWLLTAVSFSVLLPSVFLAPVLGWVVDRFPPKRLWVASLTASLVLIAGMGLTHDYRIWISLLAAQTACSIVIGSVAFTALPRIRGFTEESASSFLVGMGSLLAIITPPAAGLTYVLGSTRALLISALLVVLSLLMVIALVPTVQNDRTRAGTGYEVILLGLKTVRKHYALMAYLPVMFAVVLVTTIEDLPGVMYLQNISAESLGHLVPASIDAGPLGYSAVVSAWAVGSLAASAISAKVHYGSDSVKALKVGGLLVCAAIFFEGALANIFAVAFVFLFGGFGNAIHNIGVRRLVYQNTSSAVQGRVWTFLGASFSAFSAAGKFLGTPYLLGEPRVVIAVSGLLGFVLIVTSFIWIRSPRIAHRNRRDGLADSPPSAEH